MNPEQLLALDAKVHDTLECAGWCTSVGLLRDRSECRQHRCATTLSVRENRTNAERWCARCRQRTSVLDGSPFENSCLEIGKIIMIAFCFADCETYVKTQRACTFRRYEQPFSHTTISEWFDLFRDAIIEEVTERVRLGPYNRAIVPRTLPRKKVLPPLGH